MGKSKKQQFHCTLCRNKSSVTSAAESDLLKRITYHKFPTVAEKRKLWTDFCGYDENEIVSQKYLCSAHFKLDQFQRDFRSELLEGIKRMALHKDAIPTIKEPNSLKRKEKEKIDEEIERKKRKKEVDDLLKADSYPITIPLKPQPEETNNSTITANTVSALKDEVINLKKMVCEQADKIKELNRIIERKNEKINLAKKEMLSISIALDELKNLEKNNLELKVQENLQKFLSGNQVLALSGKNAEINWNGDEFQNAFILRSFCRNSYIFLRSKLHYPLPSPIQMQRWVHNSYIKRGLLTDVIRILQILEPNMSQLDKTCVLFIGKIKVNTKYGFDRKLDVIIDHSNYMHVIIIQSLFSEWKQIIYADFDLIYSLELLYIILTELHQINYDVVAITSDCDKEVMSFYEEAEIKPEKNFINHPVTLQPIYIFICPNRILRLIHKAICGGGFIMQDCIVTDKPLKILLKIKNNRNIKFTQQHLICEDGPDGLRRVRELISHDTSRALNNVLKNDMEAKYLSTLITLFSDWYDLFSTNYSDLEDDIPITKLPYGGSNEDDQNIVLDGMSDTVENLKCVNEDEGEVSVLHYSILLSNNSLKNLLNYFKEDGQVIATERLSLSSLMNLFCQFQLAGGSSLLSVEQIFQKLSNVIADERDKEESIWLTNKLLKKAKLNDKKVRARLKTNWNGCDFKIDDVREEDACQFLAKQIVKKLRKKYNYLGDSTVVIERKEGTYVVVPETILTDVEPSTLWLEQAKKLESYISDVTFFKNEKVVESLVESVLKKHPKMGKDIVQMYIENRFVIKINNLNKSLEDEQELV